MTRSSATATPAVARRATRKHLGVSCDLSTLQEDLHYLAGLAGSLSGAERFGFQSRCCLASTNPGRVLPRCPGRRGRRTPQPCVRSRSGVRSPDSIPRAASENENAGAVGLRSECRKLSRRALRAKTALPEKVCQEDANSVMLCER
jgi:hypothetical protein